MSEEVANELSDTKADVTPTVSKSEDMVTINKADLEELKEMKALLQDFKKNKQQDTETKPAVDAKGVDSYYSGFLADEDRTTQLKAKENKIKEEQESLIKRGIELDKKLQSVGGGDFLKGLENDQGYQNATLAEQHGVKERFYIQQLLKVTGFDFATLEIKKAAMLIADYNQPLNADVLRAMDENRVVFEQRYMDAMKTDRYNFKGDVNSPNLNGSDFVINKANAVNNAIQGKAVNKRPYVAVFGTPEQVTEFDNNYAIMEG